MPYIDTTSRAERYISFFVIAISGRFTDSVKDKLMIYVKGQRRTGIVGCIYKEKTLINFLLYLSYTIPQEIKFSPIILQYLDKFVKMRNVKVI